MQRRKRRRRLIRHSSSDEDEDPMQVTTRPQVELRSFLDLEASIGTQAEDHLDPTTSDDAFIDDGNECDEGDEGDDADEGDEGDNQEPDDAVCVLDKIAAMPDDVIRKIHTFIHDSTHRQQYDLLACATCDVMKWVFCTEIIDVHHVQSMYGNYDHFIERFCCSIDCLVVLQNKRAHLQHMVEQFM